MPMPSQGLNSNSFELQMKNEAIVHKLADFRSIDSEYQEINCICPF